MELPQRVIEMLDVISPTRRQRRADTLALAYLGSRLLLLDPNQYICDAVYGNQYKSSVYSDCLGTWRACTDMKLAGEDYNSRWALNIHLKKLFPRSIFSILGSSEVVTSKIGQPGQESTDERKDYLSIVLMRGCQRVTSQLDEIVSLSKTDDSTSQLRARVLALISEAGGIYGNLGIWDSKYHPELNIRLDKVKAELQGLLPLTLTKSIFTASQ